MIPGPKDVINKAKGLVQRLISGIKTGSPPPAPDEVLSVPRLVDIPGPTNLMRGAQIPKPPRPPRFP